ncbi:hypothetical protein CH370_16900 [Leptospira kmetyi]|uniref:Activator of Hsp90 ATPase homologue 1/2-like C-terminal domain-containing protein n=2 Tax=Leptospira kmetyi TaxID=408139 RepID=A0A2M9XLU5_9LEPT|nr:SRPBCC domain-containing protein [Leptospira kmetyi]AYV56638.1 hypothetical protein EFP84_14800 [Leptospira kmetyi]EQA53824.1 hypothetical protein LEP1GSC052_2339 [Leptospira kmetyi serovar Malaysia str. Bejo-Iso9]PJZ40194.1 hypothetical protein CH370_16900 [Leptospira kmetyi]TGK18206.1 hypothetical protein EHO62_07085 [Leptospira kmetyi]TGK26588.1 hypothetical protein EHO66_17655 [Leptospira kmetyi]
MSVQNEVSVETRERELILSRIFDAPKNLVYRVWTDPKHIVFWWGPKDFTNPICEVDLKVGGKYRLVMRSPEGIDYPLQGVYLEIVENEKIVSTDVMDDHPVEWMNELKEKLDGSPDSPNFTATVTFEEYRGKTKVTIRSTFASNKVRDAFQAMGMIEGWSESLVRFEAELYKTKKEY